MIRDFPGRAWGFQSGSRPRVPWTLGDRAGTTYINVYIYIYDIYGPKPSEFIGFGDIQAPKLDLLGTVTNGHGPGTVTVTNGPGW